MSDPLATSILAKLTSWYDFESNLTDAHGANNLTGFVVAGYEAGKVGLGLKNNSRASTTFTGVPVSDSAGKFTVGGWFKFSVALPEVASWGLTTNSAFTQNEALYIGNNSTNGNFTVFGFDQSGVSWSIQDPTQAALSYPISVRAMDTAGQTAVSAQRINITSNSGLAPGQYFVVATLNNGTAKIYVNGQLKASGQVRPNLKTPIVQAQVANTASGTLSNAGLDSCFFSLTADMTSDEINWLYNNGNGVNHAYIVANS